MSRVAVNEGVLHWTPNRKTIPRMALEQGFPLSQWLSGQRMPTLRQLESFA